ncbi:hypothetical protein R70331_07375 [Paenibacillus sp. FSL R7-0331]|nr:hypothetical protein R70331_07375 [Paenibacillus sp. FSL R7-0331]
MLASQEVITDNKSLKEHILRYQVSTMWITASLYNLMIQTDVEMFDSLNELLIGGERLSEEHVRMLKNRKNQVRLINGYGPTENTTFTTTYEIPECFELIPIGKPIANTQVYILNQNRLCGIGIPGELCIAGDGLMRGYLNKPDLTAEKLITNPFGAGKLYRTGDLARWLPNGNIEYLGRIDEQVKIRGFRIELGEIESTLRRIDLMQDAVVLAQEDTSGEMALFAYLVSDTPIRLPDIRDTLNKILPSYMIPAHMMQIDSIPVTPNGKLDRRALPEIVASSQHDYVAPRNEIEETLCQVFSQVLGVERVGAEDSFFELGGDSIKAIRIVSKMRSAGYSISVKEIMGKYTVEAIAHAVEAVSENRYEQNEVTGPVIPTPIIEAFALWQLPVPQHFNQDIMLEIDLVDEAQIHKVLTALAVHHDIIRSVYRKGRLEILGSRESKLYELKVFDVRGEAQVRDRIEAACTELQSSMDLEQGPLMKAALFRTAGRNLLFLCLHHLIVDGVSWRILQEDLRTALQQVKEGRSINLPAKTASFKEWAEALEAYKGSRQLQKERTYWEQVMSQMEQGHIASEYTGATGFASLEITLSKEETEQLVHRAGRAFNTEINDLLISAIGMSVQRLTGQAVVSVGLEGHGREEIHTKMEIDRTVGWFTSMYPIVIACHEELHEMIVATKEMLRKVPNHGLGYGVLKPELPDLAADIQFNYLGQMDAEAKDGKLSFFSAGKSSADENILPGKVSFNGYISGGRLSLTLAYDKSLYSGVRIEKFTSLYKQSLLEIIEYCLLQKETVKTPSDYSVSDLTNTDLSVIQNAFERTSRIEDIYALTPLQGGMLFHDIADKESTNYIIQSLFSIGSDVEEAYIQQALQLLALRHDVLRTAIVHENLSKPRQVLLHDREIGYERTDLSGLEQPEQAERIAAIAEGHIKRGFNLEQDPLLRVQYLRASEGSHKLIWNYHHIILDGWCLSLLYGDFNRFYRMLNEGSSRDELEQMVREEKKQNASYGEYIEWLEKQDQEQGLSYWEKLLSDYEETAEIKPVTKPPVTELQVQREVVKVSGETSKMLFQAAAAHQLTANTLVEAAWGIVLQAYSGTRDVVFGKIVSGRQANVRGIENIIGLFINTIPTRVKGSEDMTAIELLKNLQKQGTESDPYSYCSLAEIQSSSQQKNHLIKVLYVYENYFIDEEKLKAGEGGLSFTLESSREQTNYDITLCAYQDEERLVFDLLYNPNVYAKEEIQSILARIEKVLQAIGENPNRKLSEIETITEQEKLQILSGFNDTAVEYARDRTVVDLFEEQVKKTPDEIAVVFQEERLTYAELNRKVNQVAWKLRRLGIRPDDRVAIMTERSIEMIVGIYGIMKAGGAYVPIDPTFPEERIQFILEDCRPKAVLLYKTDLNTELSVLDLADPSIWESVYEDPDKVNKPDDLAYVIYTSGTTGQPKGVMLQHQGITAMRIYLKNLYQVTDQDNVLQFSNYVFDAAVWEMTLSLLLGARLTLITKEIIADTGRFNEFVNQSGITLALLPPQYYLQTQLTGLKVLTTGGSASNAAIIQKAGSLCRYVNAYGPTENTVLATHWEYDGKSDIPHPVPIGRPISNVQAYIMNGMNLCGIGIPGELCFAGDGIARGYLNMPELTAEKFISNPFGAGKLYRSGDLARWLPDGNIEYLGRIDEQVKIRGFRIELAEIESVMRKLEHIVDAVVIARKDDREDNTIQAYVISDVQVNPTEIKNALKGVLPGYMIPAFIMQIDSLPVTRSGKLDKNALPIPDLDLFRKTNRFVAANNECEHILSNIWRSILHFDEIGIDDNFFDLGGNSLLITVMLSQIEEQYPGVVKVGDVFANPTIAQLAEHIEMSSLETMSCSQISFPDSYFKQSNKVLRDSMVKVTDSGSLYQSIKAMHDTDEFKLYEFLLFSYSYLLFDATGQQQLAVCAVNQKDYASFEVEAEEDLNVLMETVHQNYQDATKFQRAKIHIKSAEKGLMPIFLYRFSGNELYKDYYDFSLSFDIGEDSVTFAAEVFNKKVSEQKLEELLRGLIQIVQYLLEYA